MCDAAITTLTGAPRRDHETVDAWAGGLEPRCAVIAVYVHGHEVSQDVATNLAVRGL